MYRRQALTSVIVSTLAVASESPSDLGLGNKYLTDMLLNPRTGELVMLGWGNSAMPPPHSVRNSSKPQCATAPSPS